MFIDSSKIKVFPTAYRATDIDTNSCLMSEQNLTYLKKLSDEDYLNSYFTYQTSEDTYNFNLTLAGYHFIFTLTKFEIETFLPQNWEQSTQALTIPIYASISLRNLINDNNQFTTLVDVQNGNVAILDASDEFKGIHIGEELNNSQNVLLLYINIVVEDEIVSYNIVVNDANNKCKLKTDEILNSYNVDTREQTSIDKQFNTKKIILDSTNGNIIKNGQSVIVLPYNSDNVDYVLSVTIIDNIPTLVWRAPYDGSLSNV